MYVGLSAVICSSKGNPSMCLSKLSSTGSASCSIITRVTFLNGSILCISVFVHLSFLWQCDTVMAGVSVSTTLRHIVCTATAVLPMAIQRHLSEKRLDLVEL